MANAPKLSFLIDHLVDAAQLWHHVLAQVEDRGIRYKGVESAWAWILGVRTTRRVNCSSMIGNSILEQQESRLAAALRESMRHRLIHGDVTPADLARMVAGLGIESEEGMGVARLRRIVPVPGWRQLTAAGLGLAACLTLVLLRSQGVPASGVPFLTTTAIKAFSFSGGATLQFRNADGRYSALTFGISPPYTFRGTMESLMKVITGQVVTTGPAAPAGVSPSSQYAAPADFLGDGTPGMAYVDVVRNAKAVTVYLGSTALVYRSAVNYAVPGSAQSVAAADFNADGKADLAVSYSATFSNGVISVPGGIAILINKGDGTFGAATPYAFTNGSPVGMAVADLNGDKIRDLVVADGGTAQGLRVMLGKADGTFQAPVLIAGPRLTSVTLGDFNGDGKVDAVGCGFSETLSVALGNGNGTFQAFTSVAVGGNQRYVAAGDFNKDGKLDIAAADGLFQTVTILLGNGSGGFTSAGGYVASYGVEALVLTDFNADGNLDIIGALGDARAMGPQLNNGNIDVLLGKGDGTFDGSVALLPPSSSSGSLPTLLLSADFDRDGKPDFVTTDSLAGKMSLFRGLGSGRFEVSVPLAVQGAVDGAVGDFNGDGRPDLAIVSGTPQNLTIILRAANGFQTPLVIPLPERASAVGAADFNGDGKLDLAVATAPPIGSTSTTPAGLTIWIGDGKGNFTASPTRGGFVGIRSLAVGDVTGDGKPDVVVADGGSPFSTPAVPGGIWVLPGDGAGGVGTGVKYPIGPYPQRLRLGDLDGDKKLDLVVGSNNSGSFSTIVALNVGNGTYPASTVISQDFGPSDFSVVDFNADARPDIVASYCCGDTDNIFFPGDGTGKFSAAIHFNGGSSVNRILGVDINGDFRPDLIDAVQGNGIVVLLNANAQRAVTVNGASFASGQPIAPDSIASVFGPNLSTADVQASQLTTELSGTTVTLTDSAGNSQLCPLFAAYIRQVNFYVPANTATGTATVTIKAGDGKILSGTVTISKVAPGLFGVNGVAVGSVVYVRNDGSQQERSLVAFTNGSLQPAPIVFDANTKQVILVLYGTGIRGAGQAQVEVTAGGTVLPLSYSGPQGQFSGEDQINVVLPASLKGSGDLTITLKAAGITSNGIKINVQ